MHIKKFTRELAVISGKLLQTDVDLKTYSYLKTGGIAPFFINMSDMIVAEEEGEENLPEKTITRLKAIVNFLIKEGKPYCVLGKASNIIIKDGILEPVVIYLQQNKVSQWQKLEDSSNKDENGFKKRLLCLPASLSLIRALRVANNFNLQGLEFFLGIPGTVGGAVVMNAGVKDQEIKNVLVNIALLRNGRIQVVSREDLDMAYRHSNISKKDIIIQAKFELKKVTSQKLEELKKENLEKLEIRRRTQPLGEPTVGSTFKNPLPNYAGALIEQCGLKNKRCGGIRVSPVHANFLVNDSNGTSEDALKLIRIIRETVFVKTGINLELEVRKFGF